MPCGLRLEEGAAAPTCLVSAAQCPRAGRGGTEALGGQAMLGGTELVSPSAALFVDLKEQ